MTSIHASGGPLQGLWRLLQLLFLAAVLAACTSQAAEKPADKKEDKPAVRRAVPVTEALAENKALPLEVRAIGNAEAYATVAVKARVAGEIMAVHFKEGQDIKKGDLLFTIDPRPMEAALREAEARLERDRALAAKAAEDNRRYTDLAGRDVISRDQLDQVRTNLDSLKATLKADAAAVESARVNLGYCRVHAPINGRAGVIQTDVGNMIKGNDDKPIVVIDQIEPLSVVFSVPESRLPELMERMRAGRIEVQALPQGAREPSKGVLEFVDNSVDAKTGTIRLKAVFANKDRRLWPGQFVNVVVLLGIENNLVTVPSQAVQNGQDGQYIFTIKDDMTAEFRPVRAGRTVGPDTVILSGVAPGERVVTEGHLRIAPGSPVETKAQARAAGGQAS